MTKTLGLAGLFLAVTCVFLFQIAARPLLPIDETRYLDVAWEMHLSGDAFHLTRNFESYSHKPPLLFWTINLVWLVTGVSEFAARLVGPCFALMTLAGTGLLACRFWPDETWGALRSCAVLAGFTLFTIYGGAVMFDALLSVVVLMGVGVIWNIGQGKAGPKAWLMLGVVLAAGVLAKGPVILVHLLPVLLLIRVWAPAPPHFSAIGRGLGIAFGVALGMVALWLVPALLLGDAAFRHDLLWAQSVDRLSGTLGHGRPIWFLLALLPVILFPWGWSWRVWAALTRVVRSDPAGRLCAIWALSGLVLFTFIGGKQMHYLLPELPAVALLVARALAQPELQRRGGSLAPFVPAGIGLAALGFVIGLVPGSTGLADLSPGWAVALFGVLCLGLAVVAFRLPFLKGHLGLGIGLTVALNLLVMTTQLGASYSTKPIAQRLTEASARGIAVVGMPYNAEFNFTGRLDVPVATPGSASEIAIWARAHPGGLIVGPLNRASLAADPAETVRYVGQDFGLWVVTEAFISRVSAPGG